MKLPDIFKATGKIPFDKIGQALVPLAIDHLLEKFKSQSTPDKQGQQKEHRSDQITALETRIVKVEENLMSTVKALDSSLKDLTERMHVISNAAQILAFRINIALILGGLAIFLIFVVVIIEALRH